MQHLFSATGNDAVLFLRMHPPVHNYSALATCCRSHYDSPSEQLILDLLAFSLSLSLSFGLFSPSHTCVRFATCCLRRSVALDVNTTCSMRFNPLHKSAVLCYKQIIRERNKKDPLFRPLIDESFFSFY